VANFRVVEANHTSFTVSSLDKTLAFFCDGLGFKLKSRAPRDAAATPFVVGVADARVEEIAFVETPSGHTIELITYSAPLPRTRVTARPCDIGAAHIAFVVENIEDAIAFAKQHGFTPLSPKPVVHRVGGPNAGSVIQYLRHDDGFFMEFIQRGGIREGDGHYSN
jgi:catechol 2,3-dioxygenase-like lactoylglutathione lyase family enzyme